MGWILTRRLAMLVAVAGLACSAFSSAAQTVPWPQKPVTLVVAFPPGGMTDIVGRLLAKDLSQTLGQPVIVENRAGAAGQVGTEYVAKRPNDGYTLLISATGHVIAPATRSQVGYDPVKDFEPIAVLARAPNLLVVNPAVPARDFPEFLKWARSQPSVPYASAGVGGSTHLAGELLRHEGRVPLSHVPYKGAAPAVNDTVAGQVPVAIQDAMSVSSFIANGQLRPIVVTSAERSEVFPQLPTLMELGYRDFDVYTWLGLYAPAGTPEPIVAQLNREVNRIINSPEMTQRLKAQYSEPGGVRGVAQVRRYVELETAKWRRLVQMTGVKVSE